MQKKLALIAIMQIEKSAAGAARVAHHQIRYLKKNGFEVHVFADRANKAAVEKSGAQLHRAWLWKGTGYLRRKIFAWQASKLKSRLKPDLTIGHGDITQQDLLFLHNCVHLAHEMIENKPLPASHEMHKAHTPMLTSHSGLIVANSNLMKLDIINRFQKSEQQVQVIYPAFNEAKFFISTDHKKANIRTELGIPQNKFLIGLVTSGNFKKRGLDFFVLVLEKMKPELLEKIHVVFVGKDHFSTPAHLPIQQLPVTEEVEKYYRMLDLFVLPARIEEFGLVASEAMACGAPVLLSPHVGAAELWDNPCEITCPLDVDLWAQRITKLMSDPEHLKKLSLQGPVFAKKAGEEAISLAYEKLFTKTYHST